MKGAKYTSGKHAWGICDVCGIRSKLLDLKPTFQRGRKTGLLACVTCWDDDHPQNFLDKYVTTDPQALRNARPDTGLEASRRLFPPNIWLCGKPPDLPTQAALLEKQEASNEEARAEDAWENRRFWRANQCLQRGERP